MSEVKCLRNICLSQIAESIDRVVSLEGIPEDIVLELFALILEKGKLSPRSVSLFNECGHEVVTRVLRVSSEPAEAPARLSGAHSAGMVWCKPMSHRYVLLVAGAQPS